MRGIEVEIIGRDACLSLPPTRSHHPGSRAQRHPGYPPTHSRVTLPEGCVTGLTSTRLSTSSQVAYHRSSTPHIMKPVTIYGAEPSGNSQKVRVHRNLSPEESQTVSDPETPLPTRRC